MSTKFKFDFENNFHVRKCNNCGFSELIAYIPEASIPCRECGETLSNSTVLTYDKNDIRNRKCKCKTCNSSIELKKLDIEPYLDYQCNCEELVYDENYDRSIYDRL